MHTIDLRFRPNPTRTCRVHVGRGALDKLVVDVATGLAERPCFVVSDSTVAKLHGRRLTAALVQRGVAAELLVFDAGESSKTRETKADLEDRLLARGAGRESVLVAVGGGVTGDLAGFVAATWHRGVPVVQAPTTLLAMVDAAIGGKTAVNLPGGKNLVGSVHQPWAVYADLGVLETLPDAEYVAGFAEVIKGACIADEPLVSWLEASTAALLRRETDAIEHAVVRCARIKVYVVAGDEHESGLRAVLNFGHTVAHAVEAVSDYAVSHGQAVALGMCAEARIACERTGFPAEDLRRLCALVRAFGLPDRLPEDLPLDALVQAARRDKKSRSGRLRCALPVRLGRMGQGDAITVDVDEAVFRRCLAGGD